MDLTTSYPRSVKEKMAGVVMLARTTDKAKALANGNIGEYHYNCPMDKTLFETFGIDHEAFLETVKNAKSDSEIETFAHEHIAKKSADEIESFNTHFLAHAPEPGSDAATYFMELRESLDPSRTDITVWADLLDLDEKRPVPHRTAA
jgi:hypothetical protein